MFDRSRVEEWYAFDRVPSGHDTRIQARLGEDSYDAPPEQRMGDHPVIWTRCVDGGRVYSALGHKPETYAEPLHLQLIGNAMDWAAEAERLRCE